MKKTLIALAAVAATSAAFAQSTVTVYGKVDVGLAKTIGSDVNEVREASGSRLGFKGTEDLGGGLMASFALEHRFSPDTGAANATYWNGMSKVGLSGGFGTVELGRSYSPAFFTALTSDVFGWDGVAANAGANAGPAGLGSTGLKTMSVRFANGIFYTSPKMSGFQVSAAYGLKEATAKNASAIRATYSMGDFSVDAAMEKGNADAEWSGIGAAYNFGVAKANVLISKGKTDGQVDDHDGVTLGLVVPMGALTLKASYGTVEKNDVKVMQKLGLGARYALSKRTDIYTSYARDSKAATEKSGWEIGLQHNF